MKARPADSPIQGYFSPLLRPKLRLKRLREASMVRSEIGMEKRCPRCGEFWPFDTEFWFACAGRPDGLYQWCRACYVEVRWPDGRPSAAKDQPQGVAS